jgi:hypothetical protein
MVRRDPVQEAIRKSAVRAEDALIGGDRWTDVRLISPFFPDHVGNEYFWNGSEFEEV